jgi:hypothetical protein
VFLDLASKSMATVSRFGPQNWQFRFGDLSLKITVMVFWFVYQNQAATFCRLRYRTDGSRMARDTYRDLAAQTLEASRGRVSQFASKLVEQRRRVVHVISSWRSREVKVEDGRVDATCYIKLFYPYFTIFILLRLRDILVF